MTGELELWVTATLRLHRRRYTRISHHIDKEDLWRDR
jgi:hypothetical protein